MSRFTSYYLYQKYEKVGDGEWTPTYPNEYSISGDTLDPMPLVIKEQNDANCGWHEPIYRWTDTDDTICVYESHDYSRDYLTIESESNNHEIYWHSLPHVALSQTTVPKTISASTDNGATWTAYTSTSGDNGTLIATLNEGEKVLLKGLNSAYGEYGGYFNQFTTNSRASNIKRCKVYGNIMSLLYGDNFTGQTALTEGSTFFYLFGGMDYSLTSAENLILPATTLTTHCYRWMFSDCYYLTTVPELPATTLADYCYSMMFGGCQTVATAPELPATTLVKRCYDSMFFNCTGLTSAPQLPATTLADSCYQEMFYGCSNLNYIKCLATDISASYCTFGWVDGVAANGTFVKNANATWPSGVDGIPNNWTIQNA